jgi:hypothetical protein
MLGVLMATARPQQRFPGLRETANLVGCAVWMRLSGRGTGSADALWAPAAAAYGLLAAMLLLVHQLRVLGRDDAVELADRRPVRLAAAPVAAPRMLGIGRGAAFIRFRVAVIAAAWTAALCQAAVAFADYPTWPSGLVEGWPTLVFAISAALALTGSGSARGPAVVGPGGPC